MKNICLEICVNNYFKISILTEIINRHHLFGNMPTQTLFGRLFVFICILIFVYGILFWVIYLGILSVEAKREKIETWIVNGTTIDYTEFNHHAVCKVNGYQYADNSVIRRCIYSKELSTKEYVDCNELYQTGSVYYWLETNSICYDVLYMELIGINLFIVIFAIVIFYCFTTILLYNIYFMFFQKKSITTTNHMLLINK